MQNTLLLAYRLIMGQTSSSLMAMLAAGVSLRFDIYCTTMCSPLSSRATLAFGRNPMMGV